VIEMDKRYYKTTVVVTVLSEYEPPVWNDLADLNYLITDGHCSGMVATTDEIEVSAKQMAQLLINQNSDPEFFGLDENGNEIE
jgi:hypothetical protein